MTGTDAKTLAYDREAWDQQVAEGSEATRPVGEETRIAARRAHKKPLEFGHSLAAQIGGQLEAGFPLVGFDEADRHDSEWHGPLHGFLPESIATVAVRPDRRRTE